MQWPDPLLRRYHTYKVAESFESTKLKMERILSENYSGKMDEDGKFTYRQNITGSRLSFYPKYGRLVFSNGWLEADGNDTTIHYMVVPNIRLVFLVVIFLPLFGLNAFFGDKSLMSIPGFLFCEGLMISVIIVSMFILKRSFENKFDLDT
jgi:hypothetical protein